MISQVSERSNIHLPGGDMMSFHEDTCTYMNLAHTDTGLDNVKHIVCCRISAITVSVDDRLKTSVVSHANEVRSLQPDGCNSSFSVLLCIILQKQWQPFFKISPTLLALTSCQPSQFTLPCIVPACFFLPLISTLIHLQISTRSVAPTSPAPVRRDG